MRLMDARNDQAFCSECEGRLALNFVAPRAIRTDATFQRGINRNTGVRRERDARALAQNAARMGVSISGKRYDGRLARFPNDPTACYGDRSEARRLCRERGVGCADLGVAPPPDTTTGRPYRVAEDIVEKHAAEQVVDNHGGTVSTQQWEAMKTETREKLTPAGV